jgi:neutral ceramidase
MKWNLFVAILLDQLCIDRFHWYRTSFLKGMSEARTEWVIPAGTEPGFYRLTHKGNAKLIFGGLISYRGHSKAFQVTLNTNT